MVFRVLIATSFLSIFLFSCKGKQEPIPAYIHIDSSSLNPLIGQGNRIQDLRFVYAYADGELLGQFELPATIPVLKEGRHKITLTPAFFLNGSNNQIAIHNVLMPADSILEFVRGKTTHWSNAVFTFRSNAKIAWNEDFEDNSSTIVGISMVKGDSGFITDAWYDLNGRYTGNSKIFKVDIQPSDTFKYVDLGSFNAFNNLPNDSRDVILEFDVYCDVDVQLALKRTNSGGPSYVPYLYIYNTEKKWKHFYVNLVYETSGQEAGSTYQILFSSNINASANSHIIQLDNIRLSFTN
ncbi:MAG: hypothetical protein KG003_12195 [Bacteroidetes bacterium]|nr:hypothetical protein [Bacteroidota bacterium]